MTIRTEHVSTGTTSRPSSSQPTDRLAATCEVKLSAFALAEFREDGLAPLASEAIAFFRTGDERPVRAVAASILGARAGDGASARHFLEQLENGELGARARLGEASALLTQELALEFTSRSTTPTTSARVPQSWTVATHLEATSVRAVLHLVRWLPDRDPDQDHVPSAGTQRSLRSEDTIVLGGDARSDGSPLIVVLPWTDEAGIAFWLALVLTSTPSSPGLGTLLATTDLAAPLTTAGRLAQTRPASAADLEARVMVTAWQRLGERPHQRATLGKLAALCDAKLTADVALLADSGTITQICDRARDLGRPAAAPPEDCVTVGWLLERACLLVLGDAAQDGSLSPALQGQLLVHLGESARSLDPLLLATKRLHSCSELVAWLADEQFAALSDRNPSVRLRAHTWLSRHQRAVPGYQPFDDLASRRAALRRHEAALTSQPSIPVSTPVSTPVSSPVSSPVSR